MIRQLIKALVTPTQPGPRPGDAGVSLLVRKLDEDRRIALVVTNLVSDTDGNPIVDHQGDVIDIDNLEDVIIESFAKGGSGMGDVMHDESERADIPMIMSLSHKDREALSAYGIGPGPEMVFAKLKVRDDGLWKRIKSGELSEVSIAGDGERFAL